MSYIRSILSHPGAQSLWAVTAEEYRKYPGLTSDITADIVIIGGGYTGLSTALYLARSGASVCVLEAHQPGWGASGRNGGQVNPTLKHDPEQLHALLGKKAEGLIEAVSGSADVVFGLIDTYNIQCSPVRSGWIQASYTCKGVAHLHQRAEQWQKLGIPVKALNTAEIIQKTGTDAFKGGWIDTRAGSVQPYSYALGLARVASSKGARIFGDTPVSGLSRSGGRWVARTQSGHTVTARQVVMATNGYTDQLLPNLAKSILSANSFIVATAPLGERARDILPLGETLSTAQRLLIYLRKDKNNRLIIGGRGHFSDPSSAADFAHLERSLAQLYPQLSPFDIEYRWGGRIAITQDFLPHVHQPEAGLTVALGYNGRGLAMGTAMGLHLANLLNSGDASAFPFPITPVKKIPFHSLQRLYITAGVAWYSALDKIGVPSA